MTLIDLGQGSYARSEDIVAIHAGWSGQQYNAVTHVWGKIGDRPVTPTAVVVLRTGQTVPAYDELKYIINRINVADRDQRADIAIGRRFIEEAIEKAGDLRRDLTKLRRQVRRLRALIPDAPAPVESEAQQEDETR